MNIIVTGGAGFIGSHVTADLIQQGHTVTVFDNLYQGHRAAVHPGAAFVHGDLADRVLLDTTFRNVRPDAVMHFASYTLVGESMEQPFLYLRDNLVNGLNLLECCAKYGVKRFVLSSTANLFDHPEQEMPITERAPIVPGSPYGEGKAMLERCLYWLDRTHGVRYAALRYFNACGCGFGLGEDHDPETHLIPIVLQVALGQRENIVVFGDDYDTPDGTCVRDYIHVKDLSSAHIAALNALDAGSRTYNLGTGVGNSVMEIVEMARSVTGHPIPVKIGARRPGDPAVLIASHEKINQDLGWLPQYSDLRAIVESAWKWMQVHPDGYSNET